MAISLKLHGSVQGVGFRPWAARLARDMDLRGTITNTADGVWIDVHGNPATLERFTACLAAPSLAGARVDSIEALPLIGQPPPGFTIVATMGHDDDEGVVGRRRIDIAPDLPSCEACFAEMDDPDSRRRGYPFISCAHCGPRFTLVRDLPWDRGRTSMGAFALCAACESEFLDPDDRRHHAESTACPQCGPTLTLRLPGTQATIIGSAALDASIDVLRSGGHLAVLGLGGFHLACDASNDEVVGRLRARKGRQSKAFAVMVRSIAEAEKLAVVDAEARELLLSDVRPIVIIRRRDDSGLSPSVSPSTQAVGLMLAYTPLHELLLRKFGGPLVMTSANRSKEPIPFRNERAMEDLAGLADAILSHDRAVESPCDDSVAMPLAGGPIWIRRSRGHVPRAIRLARPVDRPVLACGGHLGNTICIAEGDRAWPRPHIGDLDSPASLDRFEETIDRWLRWLALRPDLIAHDLHPGYASTRFAMTFGGVRRVAVQHHHAHMAAVLGEHGLAGPALGLVWDGTGAGPDGTAWGGELLVGDIATVRRLATFRPIPLAGGANAIREPWRLALALVRDAFAGDPPLSAMSLFHLVGYGRIAEVESLLEHPSLCVPAHGVGRYFDAVGAILLCIPTTSHQGEIAEALCHSASGRLAPPYPFRVDRSLTPWQIDLRPAIRQLIEDFVSGVAVESLADRFHATMVAAGAEVVQAALPQLDESSPCRPSVVLAGGCFQNPFLVVGIERALARTCNVLRARQLPPGDGGLAFGQALVAGSPGFRNRATDALGEG